jgi:hypothetical protein
MPTGTIGPTWVTRIRPRQNPRGIHAALHYGTLCADTPCGNVQWDVAHAALATRRGAGWAYYAEATRRRSASRSAAPDGADTPAPHEFCDCAEWLAPARRERRRALLLQDLARKDVQRQRWLTQDPQLRAQLQYALIQVLTSA